MCTSPHQPPRRARALRLTRVAIATAALLVPAAAHAQAPAPAVPPPVFAVPPADLATLAPPAPPTPPGVVTLHVESPAPLLILESLGLERRVVCTSPCDRVIDGSRGQSFSASGAGGSMTFKLADMRGNVDLLVRPGSSVLRNLGIVLTSVGGTAVIASPVALVSGLLSHDGVGPGFGVLGIGAAVAVGGVVLLAIARPRFDLRASSPAKAGLPSYLFGQF